MSWLVDVSTNHRSQASKAQIQESTLENAAFRKKIRTAGNHARSIEERFKTVLEHSYENSVAMAKQQLETARKALSRDVAYAVAIANWPFLRDRADVEALIAHIDEAARQTGFVTKLHAVADTARQLNWPRGRSQKEAQQNKLPAALAANHLLSDQRYFASVIHPIIADVADQMYH